MPALRKMKREISKHFLICSKLLPLKTKTHIKISKSDWEKMKMDPTLKDTLELLEDISDLEEAKKTKGKSLTIDQYFKRVKSVL